MSEVLIIHVKSMCYCTFSRYRALWDATLLKCFVKNDRNSLSVGVSFQHSIFFTDFVKINTFYILTNASSEAFAMSLVISLLRVLVCASFGVTDVISLDPVTELGCVVVLHRVKEEKI